MNSVEKISRLQTLLGRVQQRAKEPRGTSAGAVPVEASPIPPVAAVPRAAPAQIAITAPSAVTVSVDATLPFATRVPDDAIARSGMKSPLGSEPPGMQTDRAPAPARDSGAPEIEMGEVEAELEIVESPEAPTVQRLEIALEPPPGGEKPAIPPPSSLPEDLDFGDLEASAEEAPPASSKRPSAQLRGEDEQRPEPPAPVLTPPPESGPQELSAAELGAKAEALEVDLALKQPKVPREATIEQLGNTVELEEATSAELELAPTSAPVIRKPEPASEMEAELPTSAPPEVFAKEAPAATTVAKEPVQPASGQPSSTEAEATDQPITAVRLIPPSLRTEAASHAVEVHPATFGGPMAQAQAAAFVGAARTFAPESFAELLDATLSLGKGA